MKRQRPGGRTARVRSSVMDAAIKELVASGYDGLRIDVVAERSGVHRGSIYRRWATRRDLIIEAARALITEHVPVPDTGTYREDTVQYLLSMAKMFTDPSVDAIIRALFSMGFGVLNDVEWFAARVREADNIVDRAVDRGELPPEVTGAQMAELLTGPVYRRVFLGMPSLTRVEAERIVDTVIAGVWGVSGHTAEKTNHDIAAVDD
jgi:AcrR family transcriptional regulator